MSGYSPIEVALIAVSSRPIWTRTWSYSRKAGSPRSASAAPRLELVSPRTSIAPTTQVMRWPNTHGDVVGVHHEIPLAAEVFDGVRSQCWRIMNLRLLHDSPGSL